MKLDSPNSVSPVACRARSISVSWRLVIFAYSSSELSWRAVVILQNEFGGPHADHHCRTIGIAGHERGHDRSVGESQTLDASHAQPRIDDRGIVGPHSRRAGGVKACTTHLHGALPYLLVGLHGWSRKRFLHDPLFECWLCSQPPVPMKGRDELAAIQ